MDKANSHAICIKPPDALSRIVECSGTYRGAVDRCVRVTYSTAPSVRAQFVQSPIFIYQKLRGSSLKFKRGVRD